MHALSHWHPVYKLSDLGAAPVEIVLLDQKITLFRSNDEIVALNSRCSHKHMNLSRGKVSNGDLLCPMHGWRYKSDMSIVSNVGDKVTCKNQMFYNVELRYGLVWIAHRERTKPFPALEEIVHGYELSCLEQYEINASIEKVMDHFLEIEHTPVIHVTLGFDPIDEVKIDTDYQSDRIVRDHLGRQMRVKSPIRYLMAGKEGDLFFDRFTTYFSPLHTTYEHHWIDKTSGETKKQKLIYVTFFVPNETYRTTCFSLGFFHADVMDHALFGRVARKLFQLFISPINYYYMNKEMLLDQAVLNGLYEKGESINEMILGKNDAELMKRREYVKSLYFLINKKN